MTDTAAANVSHERPSDGGVHVAVGEALRIDGDVVISFRGAGPARFRVQHTRDADGAPDDLAWCDCSMMSNADIEPKDAVEDGMVAVLVDAIDGDRDIRYRRFKADWLRVLAHDDEDETEREACARYAVTILPA